MDYPVQCECGHKFQVAGTLAGTKWTCHCGRIIAIPSLSELKHQSGDIAAPPELIIQSMLIDGQLPEEDWCVICESDTENTCWLNVVCESITIQRRERLGCLSMMILALKPWALIGYFLDS